MARTLECYVFAGYPEVLSSEELRKSTETANSSSDNKQTEEVGANSAIVYGPNGEWVGGYRKTHLYETDKSWAKAGEVLHLGLFLFIKLIGNLRNWFRNFYPSTTSPHRLLRNLHGSKPSDRKLDLTGTPA